MSQHNHNHNVPEIIRYKPRAGTVPEIIGVMYYYDLSGLSKDQIISIIVSDYLEGYSTKQIMEAYRLTFVQVAEYRNEYLKQKQDIDFVALKREVI
jgi:hypothetical protein